MTTAAPETRPTASHRLKTETAHLHQQAEESPFQRALAKGLLPRDQYAQNLGQLLRVHERLESCLSEQRASAGPVARVVRDEHSRIDGLHADLTHFGVDPGSCQPSTATRVLLDDIDRLATERPLALLGMHYVLEGSMNGAKFIARNVRPAYGLEPGVGDRSLDPYGDRQREVWTAFKQDLDGCDLGDDQVEDLLAGANRMFDGVREIGEAIASG